MMARSYRPRPENNRAGSAPACRRRPRCARRPSARLADACPPKTFFTDDVAALAAEQVNFGASRLEQLNSSAITGFRGLLTVFSLAVYHPVRGRFGRRVCGATQQHHDQRRRVAEMPVQFRHVIRSSCRKAGDHGSRTADPPPRFSGHADDLVSDPPTPAPGSSAIATPQHSASWASMASVTAAWSCCDRGNGPGCSRISREHIAVS